MTTTPTRLLSLEEFLCLPETKPYTELIDGVPEQKPMGKKRHAIAQTNLVVMLTLHPRTRGGRPLTELGNRFPKTSLGNLRVPDFSYYLPGNLDPNSDEDYPDRAPDLAAEIRSKRQGLDPLRNRLAFLREQGSLCTMLVDPEAQTVEVTDGDRTWTAGADDEVTLTRLNGFSFKVRELFA